jgi:hypothetical protein
MYSLHQIFYLNKNMSEKKMRAIRRMATTAFYKTTYRPEPFKHYFRRIKTWFNGLNWMEKTKQVLNTKGV